MRAPKLKDFRHLVGVPFMSGGRDPRLGLDCWGLIMIAGRQFGHDIPSLDAYCHEALRVNRHAGRLIRELWRPAPGPGPGIYLSMATNHDHPGIAQHCGIMLDSRTVLHSLQNTGSVADNLDILQGALCVEGFYRWHGPLI